MIRIGSGILISYINSIPYPASLSGFPNRNPNPNVNSIIQSGNHSKREMSKKNRNELKNNNLLYLILIRFPIRLPLLLFSNIVFYSSILTPIFITLLLPYSYLTLCLFFYPPSSPLPLLFYHLLFLPYLPLTSRDSNSVNCNINSSNAFIFNTIKLV